MHHRFRIHRRQTWRAPQRRHPVLCLYAHGGGDYTRVRARLRRLRRRPVRNESYHRQSGSHGRSEEHTSELQSRENLVCRLLLEKKKKKLKCCIHSKKTKKKTKPTK